MKSLFHLPGEGPYLLAHSAGCLPVTAQARVERDFLAPWRDRAGGAWPDWLASIQAFCEELAALLGGRPEHWCPQPSVSGAISTFLSGLRFADERRVVLTSEEAFPSIGFALSGLAALGLQLELVRGDPSDPGNWDRVMDTDVAAVVLTHAHSNSGRVSPIGEIGAKARANGVITIVDIAQSCGILPIDVAAWPVDAVAGTSLKWLCGGPGACFLWVSPTLLERVEPIARGWFSHADPFEMDIEHFRFAPDARRFWGGTPTVAPYVFALEGLRLVREIGVTQVRAHNLRLVRELAELAPDIVDPSVDYAARSGTLCLALGPDVEAALAGAGVQCDRRGPVLRLSFAIWNDSEDVAHVARQFVGGAKQDRKVGLAG